jgi:catechol 2,3-dioxygenase-like lactoylglutathione lyase family enzyme
VTGLTHVRILVDDFAPMLAFYRDALGFKVVVDVPGPYVELDTGAARIGLCARTLMEAVIGAPMRGDARADAVLQFGVADLDAAADLLRERGVALATEPHDQVAWGLRLFHVRDPAGRLLEMTVPLAPPPR